MESITKITVYIILEIIRIFPLGSAAENNEENPASWYIIHERIVAFPLESAAKVNQAPASWIGTPCSLHEFLAVTCTAVVVLLYFFGLLCVIVSMLKNI